MAMRQRTTLGDAAFVVGMVLLIGIGAYGYSVTSAMAQKESVALEEILILGGLIITPIAYLGWRRLKELQREIGRRIAAERRSHELAHTDPLTGLANRRAFESTVRTAVALPRGPDEVHAVLMLDLKGFKEVDRLYGHAEGDDLLVAVAERLHTVTRERDLIARFDDGEFAVIVRHLSGPEAATGIAVRIMKAMEAPIHIGSRKHKIGVGIGIAVIPRDGAVADEVLRNADIALGRARKEPESTVRFFEEDLDRLLRERDSIERALLLAIGTDSLRPCYQPIVDLTTGEIVAFEALARWHHPTLGDIAPERFISIAESSGLIRDLTDWLLRCSAKDAQSWPTQVVLSLNLSPAQLHDSTLGLRILSILAECGLSPHRLEIEIAEGAIAHDLEGAKETLIALREAGIAIAIDNFGTGYASLHHFRAFKPGKIKIDRSFVRAMAFDADSAAVVKALVGLGNGLGLTVAAVGIETDGERDVLRLSGCREGQGFLFGRAVPAQDTASFFAWGGAGGEPRSAVIRT